MNQSPSISGIVSKGLSGFTFKNFLWLMATIVAWFGLMAASLSMQDEEALFLAPWWLRLVQISFIVGMVLLAFPLAKKLPTTVSRVTGQPSRTVMLPYLVLVFSWLTSHALIWGWLHHLHPGQPASMHGKVLASGRRHGKSAHGHGDWVDLQLDGETRKVHLESAATDAIYSSNDAPRAYLCSLEDARSGDEMNLQGYRSPFGFAVMQFVPLNERLLDACDTSKPRDY